MTTDQIAAVEKIAEQLHIWYLEATQTLDPANYNPKAQKSYAELNEQQKEIDRYIARKVQAAIEKAYAEAYRVGTAHGFKAGFKIGVSEKHPELRAAQESEPYEPPDGQDYRDQE